MRRVQRPATVDSPGQMSLTRDRTSPSSALSARSADEAGNKSVSTWASAERKVRKWPDRLNDAAEHP